MGDTVFLFSTVRSATIKHGFDAEGDFSVNVLVTDIQGATSTAEATVSVGGTPGETSVSFQDMEGVYTVTLTFPEGQAEGYTIVVDTDVYNTDELVEVAMPGYPADPYDWPEPTVPVRIAVSGSDIDDWLLYSNTSKSDWTLRVLITHMTDELQNIGGKYYFIYIYPEIGPYRVVAFRLVGTWNGG